MATFTPQALQPRVHVVSQDILYMILDLHRIGKGWGPSLRICVFLSRQRAGRKPATIVAEAPHLTVLIYPMTVLNAVQGISNMF